MKILLANKYLYPRGGDCIYTMRLMDLLTANGHRVAPFAMHHPENIESAYSERDEKNVMAFNVGVAPVKVAVFPLVKKVYNTGGQDTAPG